MFDRIARDCGSAEDAGKVATEGKVWMLRDRAGDSCRFLVRKGGETTVSESLAGLVQAVDDCSDVGPLDSSFVKSNEDVYLLA